MKTCVMLRNRDKLEVVSQMVAELLRYFLAVEKRSERRHARTTELSDARWQLIEPILRPKQRTDGRGRPWQDTRAVLNGILWVLGIELIAPKAVTGRRRHRTVVLYAYAATAGVGK